MKRLPAVAAGPVPARGVQRPVVVLAVVGLFAVFPICSSGTEVLRHGGAPPRAEQSLASRWLDVAQEATAREVERHAARPTVVSRTLAIWATAMYDAWAAYDARAVGSRLGGALRRPEGERTEANKAKAISYASYQALALRLPGGAGLPRPADARHGLRLGPRLDRPQPARGCGVSRRAGGDRVPLQRWRQPARR